jgi:hypothetical protein
MMAMSYMSDYETADVHVCERYIVRLADPVCCLVQDIYENDKSTNTFEKHTFLYNGMYIYTYIYDKYI